MPDKKPDYTLIADPLWRLHLQALNLCANDVITESEHDQFEDWLMAVIDRRKTEDAR